jgi:acyl dehydratase
MSERIGDQYASAPYLFDSECAEEYARAIEAPRNRRRIANIHNDMDAARRAGFPGPIVPGEHTLAVLARLLVDRFGIRFLRGGRLEAAFIKPLYFGDEVTAHARVVRVSGAIELDVWVQRRGGERVVAGSAAVAASGD